MSRVAALILLLCSTAADAQSTTPAAYYLIYTSQALCLARSQAMCTAMHCDGVQTKYWWDCSTGPLKAGTVGPTAVFSGSYALAIQASGPFAATASNNVSGGNVGLSTSEQSSLITATAIAPVLPTAVKP